MCKLEQKLHFLKLLSVFFICGIASVQIKSMLTIEITRKCECATHNIFFPYLTYIANKIEIYSVAGALRYSWEYGLMAISLKYLQTE